MFRVIVLIINLLAALGLTELFQPSVNVSVNAPSEVVAGTEFEVRISVQKGDLESFSRLQQYLPAGLTAKSYVSTNADFTFKEKRVRYIWLRMPRQEEFTVVYAIQVDERLKGTFDIKGKFSYIDQNERKSINVESSPITIIPSPNVDPALIVDINDFEDNIIPYIPAASAGSQIACIRQTPLFDEATGTYVINVLVNKESQQKFAKIEESIPADYKAVNIDPKEAIFTYKDNTAKFLWMNLPSSPYFIVSYKLIPLTDKTFEPRLKGTFSYLEDDKTISLDIKQTDKDLASLTTDEIKELISVLSVPMLAENSSQPPKSNTNNLTVTQPTQNTNVKPDHPVQNVEPGTNAQNVKNVKPLVKDTPANVSIKTTKNTKRDLQYMLEPENGVYFRVQLAAGHKQINMMQYFKKYKLDKEVRREYHDGWHKYSIGSFPVYKDARDYRVHIWNTTLISDAFVSAYNNGGRITVQEALMIGNQKWYK